MRCQVSSGTYIRSLARDIALALGTVGHLSMLRRTRIGHFHMPETTQQTELGFITAEISDFDVLDFYPVVLVNEIEADKFLHGNPFTQPQPGTGINRVLCGDQFIGLGIWKEDKLCVEKIYSTQPES